MLPSRISAGTETIPHLILTLEETYDSNVLHSGQGDAVTRIGPQIGATWRAAAWTLRSDYRLRVHTYALGAADNTINHALAAAGQAMLTPRLRARFSTIWVLADDPVVLDRAGVYLPQGGISDWESSLGVALDISRRMLLDGSYSYRRSRFELASDPQVGVFDGDAHSEELRAKYQVDRRLEAFGILGARQFWFWGPDVEEREHAFLPGLGLSWRLSRRARLSAEAGPVWFITDDANVASTYFALAQLVTNSRSSRLALIALRQIHGTTGAPHALWVESARLNLSFPMRRAITFRVTGGLSRTGAVAGTESSSSLLGRAEVNFPLGRNQRLSSFVEHRLQQAVGLEKGNRTMIGIRLTVANQDTRVEDLP